MAKDYKILTESNADLPMSYHIENDVVFMPMGFSVDEVDFSGAEDDTMESKTFYDKLKAGASVKTVALSPDYVQNTMEKTINDGFDIVYIAFSSGLSATYNNGRLAKEEIQEKYPDSKIFVIDSLAASLGEGVLVNFAVKLKKAGKSIEELVEAVEDQKLKVCHYFTVDDLNHLHRGGRVSKASAVIGSALGIKPILHVDNDGHLIPIGKVRGRKQSLDALVNKMGTKIEGIPTSANDVVMISHADSEEDAKYVAASIKKKFGLKSFLINSIGPSIGSHAGPGTIALFFMGQDRIEK